MMVHHSESYEGILADAYDMRTGPYVLKGAKDRPPPGLADRGSVIREKSGFRGERPDTGFAIVPEWHRKQVHRPI